MIVQSTGMRLNALKETSLQENWGFAWQRWGLLPPVPRVSV
jgi:hypothetical protein